MEETSNTLKRPRVSEEMEELRLAISERDKAYEDLSQKFNMLLEQNINLQAKLDALMNQSIPQLSSEEYATEEDMIVDHIQKCEKEKRKKRKKSSIKKQKNDKSQAKAGADNNVEGSKGAIPKAPKLSGAVHDQAKGADGGASDTMETLDEAAAAAVTAVHPTHPGNADGANILSKSKHIPVVTCYNINIKDMTSVIDKALGHKNYTLKIMGRYATNIGVCTIADFEKLKVLLKGQRINYYTYTPKGQRPYSLVIGGLSGTYTVEDVRDYLDGLKIKMDILGLTELGGDKWLLRLSRESDISAFLEVRYILRCRVSMRKFKRGAITQCFNCQRFGHVSSNCQMPYRCVKCGASHGPGKCDIPPKGENNVETVVTDPRTGEVTRKVGLTVRCVNCNSQGHVASSRECPRRLELVRRIQLKGAAQVPNRNARNFANSGVRTGVSYASTAALASSPRAKQRPPNDLTLNGAMAQFQTIDNDCKRLLGGGFLDRLSKMGEFARDYSKLQDDNGKSIALLGLLIKLRQDG